MLKNRPRKRDQALKIQKEIHLGEKGTSRIIREQQRKHQGFNSKPFTIDLLISMDITEVGNKVTVSKKETKRVTLCQHPDSIKHFISNRQDKKHNTEENG